MKFYENDKKEIDVFSPCKGKRKKKETELEFLD